MLKKTLITLIVLAAGAAAHAQSSPAKKELAARIIKHQQPGIEAMARGLVEQPAAQLMGNAGSALPRIAPDKQEAVAKEIQADVQKYVAEATPVVQARAVALAPATVGALLEEKFSEDELKQIVAIIESPVYTKFQRMGDELQRALAEKVVNDTRPTIEPKLRALETTVAKRLGINPAPGGGAARAPAPKASSK